MKSADKTSAALGETITYTIEWHSTGVATADVTDCFRVGDGSDDTLNALVEGFNEEAAVDNVGDDGSLQSYQFSIVVPLDPALIDQEIVNRAKITHGSVESRSDFVSVGIVAPEEVCGDDIDNDFDGETDEDCEEEPPVEEICDNGIDDDGDGETDEDCAEEPPVDDVEICDNGVDDDGDQEIDEDCPVVDDGGEAPVPDEVLPRRISRPDTLAETGPETTAAAWAGCLFLFLGMALRFVRVRPPRQVFAGASSAVQGTTFGFSPTPMNPNGMLIRDILPRRMDGSRFLRRRHGPT